MASVIGKRVSDLLVGYWPIVWVSPDYRSQLSEAQIEILTRIARSPNARRFVDKIRITSLNRSDASASWHHVSKKRAIDFGAYPSPAAIRDRKVLWDLFWWFVSFQWPGGVGLGAPGNFHVHVDFGRSEPFHFLELNRRQAGGVPRTQEISGAKENLVDLYRKAYTGESRLPLAIRAKNIGWALLAGGGLFLYYKYSTGMRRATDRYQLRFRRDCDNDG